MTRKLANKQDLEQLHERLKGRRDPLKPTIVICGGTGCHGYGCEKVIDAFKAEIHAKGLSGKDRKDVG